MNKVYEYIEQNKEKYLEDLFSFLSQKSISTIDEGVTECAELLSKMMEEVGIKSKAYKTDRHPIVYGEVIADEKLPTILVYGHYDVQPPEPLELWESDPFKPEIRGDKIYARGSSDDKSQLLAHIKGLQAYKETVGKLPVNLKYIFEGEEEIGSPNLLPFILEHKELLKSDVAVFSDGDIHESGKPIIVLGLKGLCYVELIVKGANRDLHSKKAPVIPNPAWRLVSLLNTLKGEDGIVKIKGFYDDVRELSELEIKAVSKIPLDEKQILDDLEIKNLLENRTGKDYYYNLIFEPTCNIAGLYSGYSGEGPKTIIPNIASVKIDMRLVPDQKPEVIIEKLKRHLEKHGYDDVEIKEFTQRKPSRTPIDNKYVNIVEEAVTEAWEEKPLIYPGTGAAGPNFVFTDHLNIPIIIVPFAASDNNNHAPNENMIVKGYINGIKTSATIIDKIGKTRKKM